MRNIYSKKNRRLNRLIMLPFCLIVLLLFMSACGDGDGEAYFGNKWDELVWDLGNWG